MQLTDHPPIIHFNYDETDASCRCSLCTGFRAAKIQYESVRRERAKHHRYCKCDDCAVHKQSLYTYLAASNKREIYSELSYVLMSKDKPHRLAVKCLQWAYEKILDPDFRNTRWWALNSDQRLLRRWMEDFQDEWGARNGVPAGFWAVSGLYL
jgi:hypothetical protein